MVGWGDLVYVTMTVTEVIVMAPAVSSLKHRSPVPDW